MQEIERVRPPPAACYQEGSASQSDAAARLLGCSAAQSHAMRLRFYRFSALHASLHSGRVSARRLLAVMVGRITSVVCRATAVAAMCGHRCKATSACYWNPATDRYHLNRRAPKDRLLNALAALASATLASRPGWAPTDLLNGSSQCAFGALWSGPAVTMMYAASTVRWALHAGQSRHRCAS